MRKRSHSNSDSDTSEHTNDLSKKSKYELNQIFPNTFLFVFLEKSKVIEMTMKIQVMKIL
jgi:hypothetical protein